MPNLYSSIIGTCYKFCNQWDTLFSDPVVETLQNIIISIIYYVAGVGEKGVGKPYHTTGLSGKRQRKIKEC